MAVGQALALNPWGDGCSQLGLSLKSSCGDTGSDPCVSGSLGDAGPGENLQPMSRWKLRNHTCILNREFLSFFFLDSKRNMLYSLARCLTLYYHDCPVKMSVLTTSIKKAHCM